MPVVRARTAIPSRLYRMTQPSHSREYSAHPCEYLLCIGRSGRGADSTITYSHMWCMVLDPAIYGMGAWWFERSLWLMTLLTADRKVLCKAGEQFGGPDRCSPAPLFKTDFYTPSLVLPALSFLADSFESSTRVALRIAYNLKLSYCPANPR